MQQKRIDRKNYDIIAGIDVGVNTGFAVWDIKKQEFMYLETLLIHQAMFKLLELSRNYVLRVYVEDARQREWLGNKGKEALQGAGSIKRDSSIWEGFLSDKAYNFDFMLVAPKNNMTKLKPDLFAKITGYTKRTSKHSRDAAMLCFKKSY